MDIVVTDLTRFQNADFVCTAGIDLASRIQVRPMPYFTRSFCGRLGVRPGVILRGDFTGLPERRRPHFEDMGYGSVSLVGPCSPETFHKVLADSASTGLEQGFGAKLQSEEKHIPYGSPASASLATLRIPPGQFRLASGGQDSGKIKAHLTDGAGLKMRYLSITDLRFSEYTAARSGDPELADRLNDFIHRQEELLLRIGLSRRYQAPDARDGHWLQVNAIYTFPQGMEHVT